MPTKKAKSDKRRTQVKELPKRNKKLGSAELKKVKGGVQDITITKVVDKSTPRPV
jgi:type VI protein secretion system component Hcp